MWLGGINRDPHASNLNHYFLDGYDPWGNPEGINAPARLGFGYRGELVIDGLIHLRNRDYHPTLHTFTTPDPLDGVPATPTLNNRYHYANNNPHTYTDPLGLRAGDSAFVPPQGLRWGAPRGDSNRQVSLSSASNCSVSVEGLSSRDLRFYPDEWAALLESRGARNCEVVLRFPDGYIHPLCEPRGFDIVGFLIGSGYTCIGGHPISVQESAISTGIGRLLPRGPGNITSFVNSTRLGRSPVGGRVTHRMFVAVGK